MGKFRIITCMLVVGVFLLVFTGSLLAASPITLDGQFEDWEGQAYMSDPDNDARKGDISKFYWATNDEDSNLYFMIERLIKGHGNDKKNPVQYILYFDMNDNGKYNDDADRYLDVNYHPGKDSSKGTVDLALFRHQGGKISDVSGYWGESENEGGCRCEFKVNMEHLGMYPGQPIRMYLVSDYGHGDRCPENGDIQWSPIPIMPLWALISIFVGALLTGTYFIRKRMKA